MIIKSPGGVVEQEYSAEELLLVMREDFRRFMSVLWSYIGLPEPSAVQYDIAYHLQHGPKDRGIKACRGFGKTWITNAYLSWRLYCNHNERILIISESLGFAKKSLMIVRRWIDSIWFLQHLAPRKGTKQRDNSDQFDVGPSQWNNQASVTALGITGQLTGSRATIILADDIETPETCLTINARKLLRERVKEFESIRVPGSDVIFLGTPHHEDSVYNELGEVGYKFYAWPARFPRQDTPTPDLAPTLRSKLESGESKTGDPTWPERFSGQYLSEREIKIGAATFAMQFMLRTELADAETRPLKLQNFIVYPCHRDHAPISIAWGKKDNNGSTAINDLPAIGLNDDVLYSPIFVDQDRSEYVGTKMFIDPAGGTGEDETAWAIGGQLHGYIHIKHVSAYKGEHIVENLLKMVLAARAHGVNDIYVEANFGGSMLVQLLKPLLQSHFIPPGGKEMPNGWACTIQAVTHKGQKEIRILDALEPVMSTHRLVIDPSAIDLEAGLPTEYQLQYQLTRLTRQNHCLEHDDRVEAVASVIEQFAGLLDQDAAVQAERVRQEKEEDELQKFYDEFDGNKPRQAKWAEV